MTKKEYYDLLVETSAAGGFPSVEADSGHCKYRGPNGKKCAVGLLIPDELYDPRMDNPGGASDVLTVATRYPKVAAVFPDGMTASDLKSVQEVHDSISYGWAHGVFVERLNALPCFADVAKS